MSADYSTEDVAAELRISYSRSADSQIVSVVDSLKY